MKFEKLGNIIKITSGGTPPTSKREYYENGDIPWVKTGDLKVRHITEVPDSITRLGLENSSAKIFPPNTVLVAMYGATIGACSILKIEAATNQACAALLPNEKVNEEYLYFYLSSIKQEFINKGVGGGQPNISATILKETKFPLIPLPEQLHIVNFLGQAENLINKRKQSIALLDEFLKSTFLEMFGDTSKNDKGWKRISLIEACSNKHDIKCGPFGTQLGKSEYQIDGVPVWGIPQINSQFKILPKDFVTDTKAFELDEYSVIPFDIVMSRKGNVGKCSLFPKNFPKGIIHSDVLRIRTDKKKMLPEFLLFQLKFSKHVEIQINGVSKGAIMAGINVGKLKHIIIQLPPIKLQTKFAQIVEKTEELKEQYQSSLHELENLYGSLSQRAFRGELVFPQNKEELPKDIVEIDKTDVISEKFLPGEKDERKKADNVVYKESIIKNIPDFQPLPTHTEKIKQSYKIYSTIKSHYRNRYFTFEEFSEKLIESGHDYKFEAIRNEIFNLLRENKLRQVFADAAFKTSFDKTHPDYNEVQKLKERIYLTLKSERK